LELSAKGGRSRSPRKLHKSTINLLLGNPNISPEEKHLYILLKDSKFIELIKELIGRNLSEADSVKARARLIDQLQKMLPNVNLNLNSDARTVPLHKYERFRDAVMQTVTDEQLDQILQLAGDENE